MKTHSPESVLAVRRGHRREVKLRLWQVGVGQVLDDLPITSGELTVSLSQTQQQSGRLTLAGYELWPLVRPAVNSWIDGFIYIDGEAFPIGQWPVLSATLNRPQGIIEVALGDFAFRRSRSRAEWAHTLAAGQTLAQMVQGYMGDVLPAAPAIIQDDTLGATVASAINIPLGADIWASMQEAANQQGAIIRMLGPGSAEIRKFDPFQPYMEAIDGTVITETSGEFADQAINRVVVIVESSGAAAASFTAVQTLTTGPYAYDKTKFGFGVLVDTKRLPTASLAIAQAEAKRLADRRFGIVRSLSVEVVAQPWIEVGDILALTTTAASGPEYWMVDAVTYPLTASGRMRLVMREAQQV